MLTDSSSLDAPEIRFASQTIPLIVFDSQKKHSFDTAISNRDDPPKKPRLHIPILMMEISSQPNESDQMQTRFSRKSPLR